MQFSPLAHAALDPRWDGHLLKFNHRGDAAPAEALSVPMRCFANISALSLVRADLVVDLEALAEGSFKDVEALKAIQWNPRRSQSSTSRRSRPPR